MIISTQPRVRWPADVPDDCSLKGLMVATAKENGHDDIVNILCLAGFSTWNGIGLTMRDPAKRVKLAYVLDQPVEVVEARARMLAGTIHGMDAVDF